MYIDLKILKLKKEIKKPERLKSEHQKQNG